MTLTAATEARSSYRDEREAGAKMLQVDERRSAALAEWGSRHPILAVLPAIVLFLPFVFLAFDHVRDVFPRADTPAVVIAGCVWLVPPLMFGRWVYVWTVKKMRLGRWERRVMITWMFTNALPFVLLFDRWRRRYPELYQDWTNIDLVLGMYTISVLVCMIALLIGSVIYGRRKSPEQRLEEAAAGMVALYGGEDERP